MLEKKIKEICIVTHDVSFGLKMKKFVYKLFPEDYIWLCDKVHFFTAEIMNERYPDLIISTGTCKELTRPTGFGGKETRAIYYDSPKIVGKEKNIPVISPYFLGHYLPQVLAFRLEKYRG